MFGLTENIQYYLCLHPVDMRKGINGLYKMIRTETGQSPLSGHAFIFFGKNRQTVKILKWDHDGFILYQKRLERGTFEIPHVSSGSNSCVLPWKTFSLIMQGISIRSVRYRKRLNIDI